MIYDLIIDIIQMFIMKNDYNMKMIYLFPFISC